MDEYQSSTKDDLLRGQFDSYGQPSLITIVFEEKTDENGEMYLRYYEAKSEDEAIPPYEPYQGRMSILLCSENPYDMLTLRTQGAI